MRNKALSSGARLVAVVVAMLVTAAVAATPAELTPEWLSRLPLGASLTAGMRGMVVDAAGVSYVTGIAGPSADTDIETAAYAPDGTLLWSRTYNGPQNGGDQARGITLGPGGL